MRADVENSVFSQTFKSLVRRPAKVDSNPTVQTLPRVFRWIPLRQHAPFSRELRSPAGCQHCRCTRLWQQPQQPNSQGFYGSLTPSKFTPCCPAFWLTATDWRTHPSRASVDCQIVLSEIVQRLLLLTKIFLFLGPTTPTLKVTFMDWH